MVIVPPNYGLNLSSLVTRPWRGNCRPVRGVAVRGAD